MKTLLRSGIALIALVVLAGSILFSPAGEAQAEDSTLPVGDFFFCRPQLQGVTCTTIVNVGDTVTWDFSDAAVPHTTTSSAGGWDSGSVFPGGTFQQTFTQAGSFSYVCNIHPMQMMGTIVVQAPPAATPTSPPSTPAASATPAAAPTATPGGVSLPPTGQGPQSGGSDWLLVAALVIVGSAFAGTGLAVARRVR